jgi:hypothetical protein
MRRYFHLSLIVFAFALTACSLTAAPKASETQPTPQRTPTLEVLIVVTQMVCPCEAHLFVEAWTDRNGNGNRDSEDAPLPGVRFRLTWYDEGPQSLTLTTDTTGHDFYALYGCGCGSEKVEPETPVGYKLTTTSFGECLFAAPESYGNYRMNTSYCLKYGFSPTAP